MATGRIKGITIDIGGDTSKLTASLKDVDSSLKATQTKLKDVNKLLKLDPTNTDLLKQKQEALGKAVKDTAERTKTLKDALHQMEQAGITNENREQYEALQREIVETEQKLKSLTEEQREFGSVTKQVLTEAGDKMKEVGSNVAAAGESLTKNVTAPIVAVGGLSVAAFNEVDSGLDTIIKKTGATGEKAAEFKEVLKDVATSIPTSFETAGNAIGEVNTRFGVTGEELKELSGQFIKFAELNGTDVVSSIDNIQAAMAAFGLEAEDAGDVLDILNKAGQDTGVSVDRLSQDLLTNATSFKEMGFGINTSIGFLAKLNKDGIDSAAVMTGLKKALQNATKDGKTMDQALAELQTTMANSKTNTEAMAAAVDLFGAKAGPQLATAIQEGRLSFEELDNVVRDFGESVTTTFDETIDPIDQFNQVMNEIKILGAEIGSAIMPAISAAIEALIPIIQSCTEWWTNLSSENQQLILIVLALVAALGPVVTIFGNLIVVGGFLVSAIGALISPIGLVIAILGALVAAGVLLYQNWDTIKQKAGEVFQAVSDKFNQIKQAVTDKINGARDAVKNAIDRIRSFFNFSWSLPRLKLPHISISGSFSLMPPSVPHFSIDWYKKAYDNAILFRSPTVLPTMSGMKGFGDGNGSELVVGTNKLMEMIAQASGGDDVDINIYTQPGMNAQEIALEVERVFTRVNNSRRAVFAQ